MIESTVVCFGDSNTWGCVPAAGRQLKRYPRNIRWPGILAAELGNDCYVIEEGLNGRTTVLEDPFQTSRNGREYLIPCLESHAPVHLAIIFLGTNDMAARYAMSASDIGRGVALLAEIALQSHTGPGSDAPQVLILTPPRLGQLTIFADEFAGALAKSQQLSINIRKFTQGLRVSVIDLFPLVRYSDIDGIHLDQEGHRAVGIITSAEVKRLFL